MNGSMPGFPVHHQHPELAQTHVHWAGDAIQPSHPLSSPSPPAFNLSRHQGLFQWVSSSHQVAKVLKFQLQHQSFQWIFRTDFLYLSCILKSLRYLKILMPGDFPGHQWLKLHASIAGGELLIPDPRTKIPHAAWHAPPHPKYWFLDPILSCFDLIWFDMGFDMVNKYGWN